MVQQWIGFPEQKELKKLSFVITKALKRLKIDTEIKQ